MFSLDIYEILELLFLCAFLAWMISGYFARRKNVRIIEVVRNLSIWLVIILALVLLYSFRHQFFVAMDRIKTELLPASARKISDDQIAINISNNGHFYVFLTINDQKIRFMIDTGASDLVLSAKDAKRLGIDIEKLDFNRVYNTANGRIFGANVRLEKVQIANLEFYDVGASVNRSDMKESLLGMSFLSHFKKYEFYQDRLILTY